MASGQKLLSCLFVFAYRAVLRLPECDGSAAMFPAHFLTLDMYKSSTVGGLAPAIFSAVLTVRCSLFFVHFGGRPKPDSDRWTKQKQTD